MSKFLFLTSFVSAKEVARKADPEASPTVGLSKKASETSGILFGQFQLSLCFFASSKKLASQTGVYGK